MTNFLNYLWIIVLAIYILSPIDAHPLFLDDLIASGVLIYFIYKNSKYRKQQQQYQNYTYGNSYSSNESRQETKIDSRGPLTLDEAYKLLGVSSGASLEEINKAYREKMSKSHPDKVSHLSDELQERAKELTLKLNEAFDLVKRHKNVK